MRIVTLAAVALLATAADSVVAMSLFGSPSCNKGVLWPYVRSPGDCLTDAEIAAGQRGVYNGPVQTNPDIGAIAPPPQQGQTVPAAPVLGVPADAAVPVPTVAPVAAGPAQIPATAAPGMQTVTQFSCNKGLLWPFRRSNGDCLTAAEKRNGQIGVYGGGTGLVATQVPAPAQQVIYQQVPQAQPGQQVIYQQVPQAQPGQQVIYQQVPQAQPGQQVIYQQVPQAQPGQQVIYQQMPQAQPGQQVIYQELPAGAGVTVADSTGQLVTVQPAPPPQQAAAAQACTKGALWPFIKKPGDCQTIAARQRR